MSGPERSDERDAAVALLAETRPFPGWTLAALRQAAGPDADLLFPGGPVDLVEAWIDRADRVTESIPTTGRVPDRIRSAIVQRLQAQRPFKEAVRRGMAVLAAHPATAARVTARTADALWFAAGDRSTDWNWYSKRALLAGVYGSTLLFWLRDESEDMADTLAFLDRRLAGVGRIGALRRRLAQRWAPRTAG